MFEWDSQKSVVWDVENQLKYQFGGQKNILWTVKTIQSVKNNLKTTQNVKIVKIKLGIWGAVMKNRSKTL